MKEAAFFFLSVLTEVDNALVLLAFFRRYFPLRLPALLVAVLGFSLLRTAYGWAFSFALTLPYVPLAAGLLAWILAGNLLFAREERSELSFVRRILKALVTLVALDFVLGIDQILVAQAFAVEGWTFFAVTATSLGLTLFLVRLFPREFAASPWISRLAAFFLWLAGAKLLRHGMAAFAPAEIPSFCTPPVGTLLGFGVYLLLVALSSLRRRGRTP
ncbi:TerC family protein [Brockia lithotrophica]|uniref:Putative tellurium resistance membrane protein TerC n=1 Tax=Brockia lithotrophica TaxID=933949 RepID=A0A660L3W0_9BACL|nr:hypothetical protein [Brockia lithotrophica]RKQ88701.1 putative tellurium resistance membrane protein TerC [Brockia lithotrophica]